MGFILYHLARKAWMKFQLREMEILSGIRLRKYFQCNPGKLGKRFKYLHNFLVETRLHLRSQFLYLKDDLLYFCLKHDVFKFKSTPLGKSLQLFIDREEQVFECRFTLRHQPFSLEFKDYLFNAFHPDPVIYGDNVREGKAPSGGGVVENLAD